MRRRSGSCARSRSTTAARGRRTCHTRCRNEPTYPFHDATFTVTQCERICFHGRKVNLSHAFAGQNVGVTQVGERIWLVTFMQYDLGYFDDETCRLEPIENPFGSKVSPMCPEYGVTNL